VSIDAILIALGLHHGKLLLSHSRCTVSKILARFSFQIQHPIPNFRLILPAKLFVTLIIAEAIG